MTGTRGRLLAISDLHVAEDTGRPLVEGLRPGTDDDWLLVAGDVGERFADIAWALRLLRAGEGERPPLPVRRGGRTG